MAVTQNDNVIILTAATDEIARPITVSRIRWVAPAAAAGNTLALVESSVGTITDEIWESFANGANYIEESLDGEYLPNGLRVATIDSGRLFVYLSDTGRR